jgi:hypothetical protein
LRRESTGRRGTPLPRGCFVEELYQLLHRSSDMVCPFVESGADGGAASAHRFSCGGTLKASGCRNCAFTSGYRSTAARQRSCHHCWRVHPEVIAVSDRSHSISTATL